MSPQTNTVRRRQHAETARERAAAERSAAQQRERRRRLLIVVGSTVGVLAVIGAIVAAGVISSHSKKGSSARPAASATLMAAVTGVPATTLDSVGLGAVKTAPKAVHDPALTSGGKPEVLYVGAEYCPYCAGERWALVQALSRFGTFTGLKTVRSSPRDAFPNTSTFSFYGATFNSPTIAFTGRELATVNNVPLEAPTAAEAALWHKYTGSPGSFPFLDIGGRYVSTEPPVDPSALTGLTAQEIADRLADPASDVAKAVGGAANVLTAAICRVTNDQPSSVCSAAGVIAAGKALGG